MSKGSYWDADDKRDFMFREQQFELAADYRMKLPSVEPQQPTPTATMERGAAEELHRCSIINKGIVP